MVRVTRFALALVLALAFIGAAGSRSASLADTSYMPVALEVEPDTIYVHVIAGPAWFGQAEVIAGHRAEVRDAEGRLLICATTTTTGDANMHTPLPDVVTVALDTGQSITVTRGDGPLAVAFWVGHRASVAASWPTLAGR